MRGNIFLPLERRKIMRNFETLKYTDNEIELEIRISVENKTAWLSREDMSLLFNRDRSVITRHISKVLKSGDLDQNRVCAKNAHTGPDGKEYSVVFYNLDAAGITKDVCTTLKGFCSSDINSN